MTTKTVSVRVVGDASSAQRALGDVSSASDKAASRASNAFGALSKMAGQSEVFAPLSTAIDSAAEGLDGLSENGLRTGTVLMGIGATTAAVGALMVASSKKDVQAHVQLKQAVENTGHGYESYAKRVEAAINRQERFGHTADDTQEAIRRLTEATGDPTLAIERMGLVADIAAAKHISLADAAALVAKILNGTGGKTLAAYSITMDKTKDKTSEANRALEELSRKLEGQASSSADTFSGRLDAMRAKVEDTFNAFGAKAGPVLTVFGTGLATVGSVMEIVGGAKSALAARGAEKLAAAQALAAANAAKMAFAESAAAVGTAEFAAAATAAANANARVGVAMGGAAAGVGKVGIASRLASAAFGPWGIAIAGAAIGLGVLAARHQAAEARVSGLTEAIKADSGALGENTRATVTNALQKEGALEAARKLGLDLGQVTDAAMGNTAAMAALRAEIMADPENWAVPGEALSSSADKVLEAIGGQNKEINKAKSEVKDFGSAMHGTSGAADKLTAAEMAVAAAAQYVDRVFKILSGTMSVDEAFIHTREASRALAESLKENGRTFNTNSVAGDKNRQVLIAAAKANMDLRDTMIKQKVPADQAAAAYNQATRGLRAQMTAAGMTAAEIDHLLRRYTTYAKAPPAKPAVSVTDYASRKLDLLNAKLRRMDGLTATTYVDVVQRRKMIDLRHQGRASGGPVYPGQSYTVGEFGPEEFTPERSGRIAPTSQTAAMPGGGSQTLVVQLVMPDGRLIEQTLVKLRNTNGSLAFQH